MKFFLLAIAAGALIACKRPRTGAGSPLVRLAELEIDPVQLDAYKKALREEIDTSIRVESGVLSLDAVAVRGNPTQIRIFEVYANTAAYQAHLQTPHFRKYKSLTQAMVKSLKLVETDPIDLGRRSD